MIRALIFLSLMTATSAWAQTTFKLIWNNKDRIDFKYQVFELPSIYADKVGTNGSILSPDQLTPLRELKNGEITLGISSSAILALVVHSPSGRAFDFFVAPHHTHPESAGLDFKFNCLCYHHVYHMEKGKLWYRIMKLNNNFGSEKTTEKTVIRLSHDVLEWKKKAP